MELVVTVVTSLLTAIIGAYSGYRFAVRQQALRRHFEFREKQLMRFYSPAAAIAQQLRLLHELSNEILQARSSESDSQIGIQSSSSRAEMVIDDVRDFLRYSDRYLLQFREHLLPQYRRLSGLFVDHYGLTEPDTRSLYPPLLRYLEIYDRLASETMDQEVADRLGHGTNSQAPLFLHLEEKVDEFRRAILSHR